VSAHPLDPGKAILAAQDYRCRVCGIVVPDAAWAAVCDLNDLEYKRDAGMRTCPACIRKARGVKRGLDRPRPSAPARPPLGLRITRGGE
jgi:hypothetical protein